MKQFYKEQALQRQNSQILGKSSMVFNNLKKKVNKSVCKHSSITSFPLPSAEKQLKFFDNLNIQKKLNPVKHFKKRVENRHSKLFQLCQSTGIH